MEEKFVKKIIRNYDGSPKVVTETIQENCEFENTLIEGWATIIIDKQFLEDKSFSITKEDTSNGLISMLTILRNKIIDYFYSEEINDESRHETYSSNNVVDENGLILGTRLSSLKGKNIAECSEKSIAAYVVLEKLYREHKMNIKPSLVLSTLGTESIKEGPHAFLLLDCETEDYPIKHLLFDVQNSTELEKTDGTKIRYVGLYALTDDQYDDIISGKKCTPTSLYEELSENYKEIGEKRTYGSKEQIKRK